MTIQLLVIAALLVCSAFFSGAETALFSLSRHELYVMRLHASPARRLVVELLQRPRQLLLTLMIGNVTVNMTIFAVSLKLFQDLSGRGRWAFLAPAFGLMSPLVVTLFGEILPKGTSLVMRARMAPRVAPIVRVVQIVLAPFSFLFNTFLVLPMTRLLVGGRPPDDHVTTDELRELVELSEQSRIIDADENAMLSGVIQLNELKVRDVMVPRVDMVAFDLKDPPPVLHRLMREKRFAKLPVFQTDIDHLLGVVYAKEIFLNPTMPIRRMIHPVGYVPELITLTQLVMHFRRTRTQMAIVVDEYGGVVGLVTVEDVARRIVGELAGDEDEASRPQWEQLDHNRYRVSGRLPVRDWATQFNVRYIHGDVTTLGGLVLALLGRLPQQGDSVRLGNLRLTVETLRRRRIEWVTVELVDAPAEATSATGTSAGGGGA
jgi:CBS domain containing-hemolysin-like protein